MTRVIVAVREPQDFNPAWLPSLESSACVKLCFLVLQKRGWGWRVRVVMLGYASSSFPGQGDCMSICIVSFLTFLFMSCQGILVVDSLTS